MKSYSLYQKNVTSKLAQQTSMYYKQFMQQDFFPNSQWVEIHTEEAFIF